MSKVKYVEANYDDIGQALGGKKYQEYGYLQSLVKNQKIPAIWRYSMPFLIILNIGLFVWSMVATYTKVTGSLTGFPKDTYVNEYNFFQEIKEMWQAEVWGLAIVIGFFSGVSPYLKLLLMLYCWMANGQQLTARNRGRILSLLIQASRWSFLSGFTQVFMVVGFYAQNKSLSLTINPHWGVVGNVTGTFVQIIWTNVMIYYHRKVTQNECSPEEDGLDLKELLGNRYRLSLISMLLTFGALIVGVIMHSIEFAYQGPLFTKLNIQTNWQQYSAINLGKDFRKDTLEPNNFYVLCLFGFYYLLGFIIPLLYLLAQILLMVASSSYLKRQKLYSNICEILYSFSGIEAFVLALELVYLSLEDFSDFILQNPSNNPQFVSDFCNNEQCIYVNTDLLAGSYVIIAVAIMFLIVGVRILRAIQNQINEKLTIINKLEQVEDEANLKNKSNIQ